MHDLFNFNFNFDYPPDDTLRDLGLIHRYPLHIDVLNNEAGFALYVDSPGEEPLFHYGDEPETRDIHVDDYVPGKGTYYHPYRIDEDLYLRIREADDEGEPGDWHTVLLPKQAFTKNTNPPARLDVLGFNDFDSVMWLDAPGLEGREYQVQLWFDLDGNGRLNSQGRYERVEDILVHQDGTTEERLTDYYSWQQADVYSGIHNLNTDAEAFNLDIDCDGVMDFFIS